MNNTAELPFPNDLILMLLWCQLWTGVHCYNICVTKVLCRCIIVRGNVLHSCFYLQLFVSLTGGET